MLEIPGNGVKKPLEIPWEGLKKNNGGVRIEIGIAHYIGLFQFISAPPL